jgi:3-oxoacyl-[acyl-carrier-protein] synthase II
LKPSTSVDVVVTGIGLVSALGGLGETWQQLVRGQSGIRMNQPFPELAIQPFGLIHETPIELLPLTHQIVDFALADANLAPPLADCGVVIGSSRGQQRRWEAWAMSIANSTFNTLHSPLPSLSPWLETLPHMPAIATAHQIGSIGPMLAPMAACATGLWAIAQGYELIQTGQCDRVVAGAVEAPVSPLTVAGFSQAGALATTGAYPFDRHREGLVLGEGGAVFMLESMELAERRSAPIYGHILGWGFTADGYHVSAPDPAGKVGAIAIKQCLERSGLQPQQVGYIHAHGTATQLNDRNEARLVHHLFPDGVPISSTKGATGHTLGASGALGVAFCLMAMKHQVLPPCVGLQDPEFALDLVTTPRSSSVRAALCLSFGFGGQNGAIALGRGME